MMYGDENVPDTVEKALSTKLRKLKATPADRCILLLEREEFSLDERKILAELEAASPIYPDLAIADEIWVVETVGTRKPTDEYIEFKRYSGSAVVESFGFYNRRLKDRSKDGMPVPLPRI